MLRELVGVDGPYVYERPFFALFFPAALLALGSTGLVVFAILLYRPLAARRPHVSSDWDRAEDLVHRYGWDTLAYFALRDDKSFFFSSDGEAMLAYTYLGGYALVSGDPIGAPASVPQLLDEFLAMCEQRAWNPAFLAVREADLPLYAARGFRDLYLGDEAIVRCDRFTLDGPVHKGLRAAVRRVGRRYTFQLITEANAPAPLVDALNAISARWRGKAPERGFTMSLSQDVRGAGANPEFLLCVALDAQGRPGGFLRLVPAYGADFGYTLDLMRHDPDAPNGMTEFLIASTAAALRGRGVVRLSMNFAVWGGCSPTTSRSRGASGWRAAPCRCSTRSSRSARCATSMRSSTRTGCRGCSRSAGAATWPGWGCSTRVRRASSRSRASVTCWCPRRSGASGRRRPRRRPGPPAGAPRSRHGEAPGASAFYRPTSAA